MLAPTGTIGLLMDCDTTGVEPDFALVKFKKLAGGGYFKIVNQSVPAALQRLGYDDPAIERIVRYAVGTGTLEGAPHINRVIAASTKGLTEAEIDRIEKSLPSMLDIRFGVRARHAGRRDADAPRREHGRAREAGLQRAAVPRLHRRADRRGQRRRSAARRRSRARRA